MRFALLAPYGFWLPIVFLILGTALPPLGSVALDGLGPTAFAIVLFGVLAMPFDRPSGAEAATAVATAGAVALLAPLSVAGLALVFGLPPTLLALMVIAAAAPIGQSIGALVAILKLPERGVTVAALISALATPAVLPLVGWGLAQDAIPVSVEVLARRAALFVLVPALIAFALRRACRDRIAACRGDFRGLVILALSLFAMARGPGLRHAADVPLLAAELALLAFAVSVCAMLAAWAATRPFFGREVGLSGMFAGGARNVPVAWAAVAPGLDATGHLFMTLTVLPMYVLPLAMQRIVRWSRRKAVPPRPVPAT
jgi:hypothetical protein